MIFFPHSSERHKTRVETASSTTGLGQGWAHLSLFPSFVKELVFAKTETLITVLLFFLIFY